MISMVVWVCNVNQIVKTSGKIDQHTEQIDENLTKKKITKFFQLVIIYQKICNFSTQSNIFENLYYYYYVTDNVSLTLSQFYHSIFAYWKNIHIFFSWFVTIKSLKISVKKKNYNFCLQFFMCVTYDFYFYF